MTSRFSTLTHAFQFPKGFLWGAATSSHQVEGNNHWNDWWEHEQSGHLPHRSGDACQHYELYEKDFTMAQSWGHNAHRFSIEWSRIEPSQGTWNPEAIGHYQKVIASLKERGLEPIVTLHHFTNPAWFARRGGWRRFDGPRLFARYTEYVANQLGGEIKYWLTINEPTVYVLEGYVNGSWPPFSKSSWTQAAIVLRNLARAHVKAYRVLHEVHPDAAVGFAHSAPWIMPCDPTRRRDRISAQLRDLILNRLFFHLIGVSHRKRRTARTLDFVGINYYTRTLVRSTGWGLQAILGKACKLPHHTDRGPLSSIGWEVYPAGLEKVLVRFSKFGIPLCVTENGIATDDEALRRDFLLSHLETLGRAIKKGAPVFGYLYWSLIDNFEWAIGKSAHFGLAEVNDANQTRIPRPCVDEFRTACLGNRLRGN